MSILIKNVFLEHKKKDVYIEENQIKEINDKINIEAEHKIDGKNKAIIPGLINAHTHAAMTLLRGYADDKELMEWLNNFIWPIEAKMTEKDIYVGSKLACLEMIKSGTIFFNDMYWHYHGTAKAVEELGIRAAISAVLIDMFDEKKAEEQKKLNTKLFNETKKYSDRVIFALGPHAIYTVSKETLQWCRNFSEKNNCLLHIHVSESKKEVDDSIKQNKLRPIEYLEKIGFLSNKVIACHSVWLNNREIELLKKHNISVSHNPISNMKLSSGILPYPGLKKAGVNIALGTDGCASNNNLDMFESMKIAALLQKLNNNPTTLPAKKTFEMATINGAKAFGLNNGEIKQGKLADVLLIDLNSPLLTPHYNLYSDLVYSANGSCVDTTICNGKILMQGRKVEGEEKILDEAAKQANEMINR